MTGSIGVLSGKLVTGGLWQKLLFNRETIAFGDHVLLENDQRPFTDEERAIVRADIDRIYGSFLKLVASARKMTTEDVDAIAQGKVWTGRQALERKLVDELGGLEAGTAKARALANLPDKAPIREVRGPKRLIPPLAEPVPAAGWFAYVLDGVKALAGAPALAVMEYWTSSR